MGEPSTAIVHFYRAIVMHADVWRQRLDATTNWAVVTNVGVISFSFTRPDSPHFLLLILNAASFLFLLMESRRYQLYDIWRRRIRTMNRFVIAPELSPGFGPSQEKINQELEALANELGHVTPCLSFLDAMGYRIRRNYGYLFLFSIGSWVLKLFLHPDEAPNLAMILDRAAIGGIHGFGVLIMVFIGSLFILFLAMRAPSEQMVAWQQLPSPLARFQQRFLLRPPTEEEEESRPEI